MKYYELTIFYDMVYHTFFRYIAYYITMLYSSQFMFYTIQCITCFTA